MAYQNYPTAAILYQNAAKTVTLLDIPTSIALAQGASGDLCAHQLYASAPLLKPFPSTEPKSEKARAKVLPTQSDSKPHYQFPQVLLHHALRDIAENWDGEWCIKRLVSPFLTVRQSTKRTRDEATAPECPAKAHESSQLAEKELRVSTQKTEPTMHIPEESLRARTLSEPLHLTIDVAVGAHVCSFIRDITNKLVHNSHPAPVSLQCSQAIYLIPPSASFVWSEISEATASAFSMAALTMYNESSATTGPGQFDFVLLDPPWENRSVRRSAKYKTMCNANPMNVLRDTLAQHIAPGSLVGCWVTNKASVREAALDLFTAWGLQIIEEWAWLKTTAYGLPITDIEGAWRKPYEILLLGRNINASEGFVSSVQRRVIVAVPDVHSRKPHLRALAESILPVHYRALEVFARNMTAGWMVWGDEVLKFNWEGHWSKRT